MQYILYLHGFHSSPLSQKATEFKRYVDTLEGIDVIAPQLPVYPEQAAQLVTQIMQDLHGQIIGVVGSSLGGFLSTYIHNEFGIPAVVINPAVRPFELLSSYLGPQTQPITGENYVLETHHMLELKALYQPQIAKPQAVWLLQQEGDEVLDYRQALEHYQFCKQTVEPNGNHAFERFQRFPAQIVEFIFEHQI